LICGKEEQRKLGKEREEERDAANCFKRGTVPINLCGSQSKIDELVDKKEKKARASLPFLVMLLRLAIRKSKYNYLINLNGSLFQLKKLIIQ